MQQGLRPVTILLLASVVLTQAVPITFPAKINYGKAVSTFGVYPNDGLDDTQGILSALDDQRTDPYTDYFGLPKMVYFPAGTYDVSDSLVWIGCGVTIQGQGMGETVFKLKANCPGYSDATKPRAVWRTIYGNQAFRQNFHDLTIRVGAGNPGAIGLDYISSNVGTVENVEVISEDGNGYAGIEMTRSWPGPCLLRNIRVDGFNIGIRIGQAEYGPTFENVWIANQKTAGIDNVGNVIAVRRFNSTNTVQAIRNSGHLIILEALLTGTGGQTAGIVSTGDVYARNISYSGYTAAISSKGQLVTQTPLVEYVSAAVTTLFPCPKRALGLPIQETPEFMENDVSQWATFDPPSYGQNSLLQTALNSGKSTVCFPAGIFYASPMLTVTVPATVRRIIGFDGIVNAAGICFRVQENSTNPLIIERFGNGTRVEHQCARPIVIAHGGFSYSGQAGAGDVYFEDVAIDSAYYHPGQNVWARQYNTESLSAEITKVVNDNAKLWILGIKTEGSGTVVETKNGGFTEVLGTLIYPVTLFTASSDPGFINNESNVSLVFRSTAYAGMRNYPNLIVETRGGVTKAVTSGGGGMTIPLYAGFDSTLAGNLQVNPVSRPVLQQEAKVALASSRTLVVMPGAVRLGLSRFGNAAFVYDLRGRSVRSDRAKTGVFVLNARETHRSAPDQAHP